MVLSAAKTIVECIQFEIFYEAVPSTGKITSLFEIQNSQKLKLLCEITSGAL